MDNRVAVPGYKVYEEPDGSRPAVHVAFLDLEPAVDGADVNGALLPADAAVLAELGERERQYRPIDVTEHVADAPGRVWAFVGAEAGRARVAEGRRGAAATVIQRAYVDLVERAFATLGPDELARYRASTEPPPFPVVELARVDLPPA
jgi:hypothetical protein